MTERKTVVLCGSVTRAVAALDAAEAHYGALGYRVHKPVKDDSRTPQEHAERHFALIDACGPNDVVVICCPPGQDLGEQTTREMDRALDGGKRVEHWRSEVTAVLPAPDTEALRPLVEAAVKQGIKDWDRDYDSRACGPITNYVLGALDYALRTREAGLRADLDQARRDLADIRAEAGHHIGTIAALAARVRELGAQVAARDAELARVSGARAIPDDAAERLARLLYAATRTDARLPAEIPDNWVGEHGHVLVERGYDKTWIDYARKVLTDLGLSTTRTPPAPAATVVQWLPATYVNTAGGGGCANCNGYQPLGHEGKCYPYGQGPTPDRLPPNTRFVFSPSATAEPTATGNLHDADVTEDPNEPGRYIATCPACHVSITGAESVVEDAADQHFSEAALGVGYQALTTEPDDEWENRHDPAEDIGCTNPPAVSCSDAGCPRHGWDTEEGDDTDE